jgi:hypothetical protein
MMTGFERYTRKTRRAMFLQEMSRWCRRANCSSEISHRHLLEYGQRSVEIGAESLFAWTPRTFEGN